MRPEMVWLRRHTGFLERTYCHPEMARKRDASASMLTSLHPAAECFSLFKWRLKNNASFCLLGFGFFLRKNLPFGRFFATPDWISPHEGWINFDSRGAQQKTCLSAGFL